MEAMVRDLVLNERRNITVRTSHYPNDPRWYDCAISMASTSLTECDLETHGFLHDRGQREWC